MISKFSAISVLMLFVYSPIKSFAAKQLALKLVASIENHILTNRDVETNFMVDRALYNDSQVSPPTLGTEEFNQSLNRLLVEMMVSEEATFFEVAKVTPADVEESFQNVKKHISASTSTSDRWRKLSVKDQDLKAMVSRKLRANRFIKYKSNSSFVEPSDEEARDYFKKNRLKFGTMEFESFKGSIQKFLGKRNAEDRLRDWFDILRKKHQVTNFMTGSINYDLSHSTGK